jgi:hypothetical protein
LQSLSFRLPRRPYPAIAAGGLAFLCARDASAKEWSERRDSNPRPFAPQAGFQQHNLSIYFSALLYFSEGYPGLFPGFMY